MVAFTFYFALSCIATAYATRLSKATSSSSNDEGVSTSKEFKLFQKLYLGVYYAVMAGDWLQGPYVYALYSSYGFTQRDIAGKRKGGRKEYRSRFVSFDFSD
jgi:hypothetical protein